MSGRGLNTVLRLCNRFAMTEHKIEVLPEHFKLNANTRPGGAWNYRKRDKKYQKYKARTFKHQRPLVQTGELERKVIQTAKVTATRKRSRLVAYGSSNSPITAEHRAELEALSPADDARMRKTWEHTFDALSKRPEYQRKVRKRNAAGRFI